MTKNWWFKFNFKDWRTDSELRRCSLETRGFWLEVLCVMHETDEWKLVGSYEELGWLIGCSPEVIARCVIELKRTNTADVTLGNGDVTLVSRRLKREANDREQIRLRVAKYRGNSDVTNRVKSNKKEVISKKKEKKKKAAAATPKLSDNEWLDFLAESPAYKDIPIRKEFEKAKIWYATNNRQATRRAFVGWLNRIKPMDVDKNGSQKIKSSADNEYSEQSTADTLARLGVRNSL